jgi:hypothetical protein
MIAIIHADVITNLCNHSNLHSPLRHFQVWVTNEYAAVKHEKHKIFL